MPHQGFQCFDLVCSPLPKEDLVFTCLQFTGLLKTLWEKEKLLVTSNLSFSHSVFYPFGELSSFSSNLKLSSAHTLSVWKHLTFVVLERVKELQAIRMKHLFTCYSITRNVCTRNNVDHERFRS